MHMVSFFTPLLEFTSSFATLQMYLVSNNVFFVYTLHVYIVSFNYHRQARTPLPFRNPPPLGTLWTDPECTHVPCKALHDVGHDWSLVSYGFVSYFTYDYS